MAKITIDFGYDFVREYTTTDDIDKKLKQGEMLKLETMHPRHAEHVKISVGRGGTEIKIPLDLVRNIFDVLDNLCGEEYLRDALLKYYTPPTKEERNNADDEFIAKHTGDSNA